jgi:hypothetical protein
MLLSLPVMAFAVSLEPFRIGMTVLMLNRPRPMLQLLAFLCGGFTMGLTVGLVVLFALRRSAALSRTAPRHQRSELPKPRIRFTRRQLSASPHDMALTAVDNRDLNASGMGMYPLSAKPFWPAPLVVCKNAFTAAPTWGSGYFEQTISYVARTIG